MKDPSRIPEIMRRIQAAWERNPDALLGPVVCCARWEQGDALYYAKDEEVADLLIGLLEEE